MAEHQPAHGSGKLIPWFALLVHAAFSLPILVFLSQFMSSHFHLSDFLTHCWEVRERLCSA